jgi:ribosomal protein S18 acetylase RimI-like enzyme
MLVQIATPEDAAAIHDLLDRARNVHLTIGNEDLMAALAAGRVLLLREEAEQPLNLLGVLITVAEERSPSLPASSPELIHLRGVAFQRHFSPTHGMQHLLGAFALRFAQTSHPLQLIAYSGEGWLDRALRSAGMTLAEHVQFFVLERLQKRHWEAAAARSAGAIHIATPDHLAKLADLDAVAFPPLWRYSLRRLQEALWQGPLLVAQVGDELIGYSSLLLERDACTIARLAVHPNWQGQGYGRALLLAGLQLAQEQGCDYAMLNTQAANHRSQQLYRSLGFRPTGESFAVFVLDLPSSLPAPLGVAGKGDSA